ncbi:MAG: type II secretion system protein [Desulfatirhabdiaceae bacterium]
MLPPRSAVSRQPFFSLQPSVFSLDSSAFTLLEVLVALVIIGISLGVAFEALSGSRRLGRKADDIIAATRVMNNLLVNSLLIEEVLEDGYSRSAVTGEMPDDPDWQYEIDVQPLDIESDDDDMPIELLDMASVTFCVMPVLQEQNRRFCLTRWMRIPTGSTQVQSPQTHDNAAPPKTGAIPAAKTQ